MRATDILIAAGGLTKRPEESYVVIMTKLEEIEKAITKLPPRELEQFRAWFEAFESERFDRAIERDATSGTLDHLAEQAIAEYAQGRARKL